MHCPKASRKGIALNTEEERRKGKARRCKVSLSLALARNREVRRRQDAHR